MSASNTDRMEALRAKAKDLQARLGYLFLQEKAIRKEVRAIEALLQDGEREFDALQRLQDAPSRVPEIIEG